MFLIERHIIFLYLHCKGIDCRYPGLALCSPAWRELSLKTVFHDWRRTLSCWFWRIGCCNGVSLGTPSCCNSGCCGRSFFIASIKRKQQNKRGFCHCIDCKQLSCNWCYGHFVGLRTKCRCIQLHVLKHFSYERK